MGNKLNIGEIGFILLFFVGVVVWGMGFISIYCGIVVIVYIAEVVLGGI